LDPAGTKQIEELVLGLKPRYTILIVTHNLAQAKRVSDRAIFMLDGRSSNRGPRNRYSAGITTSRDFVSGQIG